MPQIPLYRILIYVLLIPVFITATDYFPLSTGNRWHYRFIVPNTQVTYNTYEMVSDTMVGQRRYFVRQWSSCGDTVFEWLYVTGNDVYSLRDLSKPDSAIKIAQKSYATGDSIYDGTGLFGKVQLVVSYHRRDSAPAGTYDSTWTAGWVDADTIAGGLILIRNEIHHVYAHEVGEICANGPAV